MVTAVIAISACLYLNVVSIGPDKIWAMRRFLPVILPGRLLVAWCLNEFYQRRADLSIRLERLLPAMPAPAQARVPAVAVVVLTALVAVFPVFTWGPMFPVREVPASTTWSRLSARR